MKSPSQLSFLPEDYLRRKSQRRANVICAGLFVIVMAAIGTAFTLTERSMRSVEKQHADVEREFAEAARRIQQVQEMQEKQRQMAEQAELTASLLEKVPRTYLLAEITNALPAGVSLMEFSLDSKRRNVTPATPANNRGKTQFEQKQAAGKDKPAAPDPSMQPKVYDVVMKATGIADSDVQVATYISKLNRSQMFKEVNLLISDQFNREGATLRKFTIELTLGENAEVAVLRQANAKTAAVELEGK